MQVNNIRAAVFRTYRLYYNHVHLQELHMQQSASRKLLIGLGRSQALVLGIHEQKLLQIDYLSMNLHQWIPLPFPNVDPGLNQPWVRTRRIYQTQTLPRPQSVHSFLQDPNPMNIQLPAEGEKSS